MARKTKKKSDIVSQQDSSDVTIDRDSGGELEPENPETTEVVSRPLPASGANDGGADPAFVYFKDLGRFKILSREKEVEVARRIEGHKIGIKKIVFSSIVVLDELVDCIKKAKESNELTAMIKDEERCIRCGLCSFRCPTEIGRAHV